MDKCTILLLNKRSENVALETVLVLVVVFEIVVTILTVLVETVIVLSTLQTLTGGFTFDLQHAVHHRVNTDSRSNL